MKRPQHTRSESLHAGDAAAAERAAEQAAFFHRPQLGCPNTTVYHHADAVTPEIPMPEEPAHPSRRQQIKGFILRVLEAYGSNMPDPPVSPF